MKILATSSKTNKGGLLPMKQSPELEEKKTENQKMVEFCNFIKNSWCVDGKVKLVEGKPKKQTGYYCLVEDSKRGKFTIEISPIEDSPFKNLK